MSKVVVCGAVNFDITMKLARFPRPGETITGARVSYAQGGKGANQAVAAAQAGARTIFAGAIGADEFGARIAAELAAKGVQAELAQPAAFPTGVAVVLVDDQAESAVIVDLGANQSLGTDASAALAVSRSDIVLLQNEIPLTVSLAFAHAAHNAGATVVLNASPFSDACAHDLRPYDYLIVNEVEFAELIGRPAEPITVPEIESALAAGVEVDVAGVVVTAGPQGVRASIGGDLAAIAGHDVRAVDTTGAGDCFCGSFAAALAKGFSPAEGLSFANAAAALSVQSPGAGPSMPSYERIVAFLEATS